MTKINRIPSEPPRDNTWLDYHREMSAKYSLFVRFKNGNKPYYTDAYLTEVLVEESDVNYFEVNNCDWTSEKWDEIPSGWRVLNLPKYYRLVAQFKDETGANIGERVNGEWSLKIHRADGVYFLRDVKDGYMRGGIGNAVVERSAGGDWLVGNTARLVELKSAPTDELKRIARRLDAKHRRGFYDADIEWLAGVGGFRRAEI